MVCLVRKLLVRKLLVSRHVSSSKAGLSLSATLYLLGMQYSRMRPRYQHQWAAMFIKAREGQIYEQSSPLPLIGHKPSLVFQIVCLMMCLGLY